jgi:uncharacterized iron-regulated protein
MQRALKVAAMLLLALALNATGSEPGYRWESRLRGDAVVLLGEVHDNEALQRSRLEVLRRAFLAGWRPALAMEQFDREHQQDIEAARQERPRDADYLIRRAAPDSTSSKSGWDWRYYRPYVELALEFDVPVLAANLSRTDAEKIVKDGYASVFDAATVQSLRLEEVPTQRLAAQEREVDDGHCHALPKTLLPAMTRAQLARDAVMAAILREHASTGIVLLTGNGHARGDIGVPAWLDGSLRARTWTVGYLERGGDDPPTSAFDAVVTGMPASRPDPCLTFKRSAP